MRDWPAPQGITEADWTNTPPAVRARLASQASGPEAGAELARLSQQLEAALAPDAILPTIVDAIGRSLNLPYVAITLKRTDNDEFEVAAEHRAGAAPSGSPDEDFLLPLLHQMEIVGQLIVRPRASGGWSSQEQALIAAIAQRAGGAAAIMRMTATCSTRANGWCWRARRSAAACAATCTTASARPWPARR
jgi:hypothetical protein